MKRQSKDPLFAYLEKPVRRRLQHVVREHYRAVWDLAFRLTRHEDDASDIAQEVFLNLFLEPPDPSSVQSPTGYLSWRVVARISRMRRAQERRRKREEAYAKTIAEDVVQVDDVEAVTRALETLPEDERTAFELRYFAGLPMAEVARLLGIGERAARLRLEKGRDHLRSRLASLFSGALFVGALSEAAQAAPPAELLPRILKLVDAGEALVGATTTGAIATSAAASTSAATATTGKLISATQFAGVLMSAKKTVLTGLTALLLVAGVSIYFVTDPFGDSHEPDGTEALSSETNPAGTTVAVREGTASILDANNADPTSEHDESRVESLSPPSIHGRVLDSEGVAISLAEVWVLNDASWASVAKRENISAGSWLADETTLDALRDAYAQLAERTPHVVVEADGAFAFSGLTEGRYRLVAVASGYLASNEVLVDFFSETKQQDILLTESLGIQGRVVDASGTGIQGASISWLPSQPKSRSVRELLSERMRRWETGLFVVDSRTVTTDRDGAFEIASIVPGNYDLGASAKDMTKGVAREIAVGTREVRISMTSGLSISGHLVDPRDRPVSTARLQLLPLASGEVHRYFDSRVDSDPLTDPVHLDATASADGSFRVSGLKPGSYELVVEQSGFASLRRELDVTDSVDLGVLKLETAKSISGTVLDENGRGIANAKVWVAAPRRDTTPSNRIQRPLAAALESSVSDADGTFTIDNITGDVELLADHPDFAVTDIGRIEAGKNDVQVVLQRGLQLRLRVSAESTGRAIENAKASSSISPHLSATSDANGEILLRGLSYADTHRGKLILSVKHPDFDNYRSEVLLSSNNEDVFEVRLSEGERIDGRVLNVEGEPIRGARLFFVVYGLPSQAAGYNPAAGMYTYSEKDGSFSIPAPGELRNMRGDIRLALRATAAGLASADFHFDSIPGAGQAWLDVELTLNKGEVLEGTVRSNTGEPIFGARVEVVSAEDNASLPDGTPAPTAYSRKDGSFVLRGIRPESRSLRVSARGYASLFVERPSDDAKLEASLVRGLELSGRVVDQDGSPVADVRVSALEKDAFDALTQGGTRFGRRMALRLGAGIAQARTDPSGAFSLQDLSDQALGLVAYAPGYETQVVDDVEPSESLRDIVLQRFSAVRGRVVDAKTGRAISGFSVNLVNLAVREREQKKSRMADPRLGSEGELVFHHPDGRFLYDGLHAGRYEITVHSLGHALQIQEIELAAAAEENLKIALDPGASVHVQVLYKGTETPVPGALVHTMQQGKRLRVHQPASIFSDTEGRATCSGLVEGEYSVVANHPLARFDHREIPKIKVPTAAQESVVVYLEPASRIYGQLQGLTTDGDGSAHRNNLLELRALPTESNPQPEQLRSFESSIYVQGNGRFSRDSLKPGRYALTLVSQDQIDGEMISVGPTSGFSSSKEVGEATRTELGEIVLEPGQSVEFTRKLTGER